MKASEESTKDNNREDACLSLLKELLENNEFIVNNFVSDKLIIHMTTNMLNNSKDHTFKEKKYL